MTEEFVVFKGKKFYPPYRCLCCGKEVSVKQFCFGRLCAYCDLGKCQKNWKYLEGHGRKDIFEDAEKMGDEFQEIVKAKLRKIKKQEQKQKK